MLKTSLNPSVMFVSFSGIDGAGKSTQIENLRSHMEQAGLRVRCIPFWDDVARLKGVREFSGHKIFKGEKGVGSPDKPINRQDKNVRSWKMTLVRYFLYFVDSVSLRRVVRKALKSDADFVIFDRYAYDELANLNLKNVFARAYVRFIMSFVPRPHVSYILDADPVAARARKPEYPLEFLHSSRASYAALSALLGGITTIPPMPVEDVETAGTAVRLKTNARDDLARGKQPKSVVPIAQNSAGSTEFPLSPLFV